MADANRVKITALTDEQRDRIPEWCDRTARQVLDCTPADREAAERAVAGLYRTSDLPRPRIVHVGSPLVAAIAGSFASTIWHALGRVALPGDSWSDANSIVGKTRQVLTDLEYASCAAAHRDPDGYGRTTYSEVYSGARIATLDSLGDAHRSVVMAVAAATADVAAAAAVEYEVYAGIDALAYRTAGSATDEATWFGDEFAAAASEKSVAAAIEKIRFVARDTTIAAVRGAVTYESYRSIVAPFRQQTGGAAGDATDAAIDFALRAVADRGEADDSAVLAEIAAPTFHASVGSALAATRASTAAQLRSEVYRGVSSSLFGSDSGAGRASRAAWQGTRAALAAAVDSAAAYAPRIGAIETTIAAIRGMTDAEVCVAVSSAARAAVVAAVGDQSPVLVEDLTLAVIRATLSCVTGTGDPDAGATDAETRKAAVSPAEDATLGVVGALAYAAVAAAVSADSEPIDGKTYGADRAVLRDTVRAKAVTDSAIVRRTAAATGAAVDRPTYAHVLVTVTKARHEVEGAGRYAPEGEIRRLFPFDTTAPIVPGTTAAAGRIHLAAGDDDVLSTAATSDFATVGLAAATSDNATHALVDLPIQAPPTRATDSATATATTRATDSATARATDSATGREARNAVRAIRNMTVYASEGEVVDAVVACMDRAALVSSREYFVAMDSAPDDAIASARFAFVDPALVSALAGKMLAHCSSWYAYWNGGNQQCGWFAHLTFFRDVCGLDLPEHRAFADYELAAASAGGRMMHREFCIVCDRPEFIRTEVRSRTYTAHCDGGPSHRWRDGWTLHHLNGVRVPAWVAETSAHLLDPRRLREIQNVQVRREFVSKVGIDRLLEALSDGPADKDDDYELHLLRFEEDGEARPYLRMRNPSVPGVWHVEGVDPSCTTVQEALNFRNGLEPHQIDPVHGADWYQQGDVLLFPAGATKFKPRPKILT